MIFATIGGGENPDQVDHRITGAKACLTTS